MEVFVAILLLFGAYSLGATSHDDTGNNPTAATIPAETSNNKAMPGTALKTKAIKSIDLVDCAADRHYVIYKDLTHSEVRKDEADTTPSDECEGACRDE